MAEEIKNLSMNIVVDDGSRRVPIMNTQGEEIGVFTFRPTDVGIIKRYNEMVNGFDSIVEPLEGLYGAGDDIADPKYVEALNAAEGRLYEAVNTLFDRDDAADAFFGKMNPFSPVEGEFYCARVLTAVGQYINGAFDTETAKFSANAKKYAKKATRK